MKLGRRSAPAPAEAEHAAGAAVAAHLGVLARPWRAIVTDDGTIVAPDGAPLRWAVVAEDRVHQPATSSTMRLRCVDGTPVVETALRVPGGDVVVTAFAAADGAGALVLEVENRAGTSVAFACSRDDVVAARPLAPPPAGGELPSSWRVLPLAHGSSLRVALAVDAAAPPDLATLPDAAQVVRGWTRQLEGGLLVDLPDPTMGERLVRSRSEACLAPWPDPDEEPERFLLRAEQVTTLRLLDAVRPDDVAAAATNLAAAHRRAKVTPWAVAAALAAAARVLNTLGDERGALDARAIAARLAAAEPVPEEPPVDPSHVEAWLGRRLAVADGAAVRLLPAFPRTWLGANLSAYQVPTTVGLVGFAVRWHGERPALLWDVPPGVVVTCPGLDPTWSSSLASGEALLAIPG